MKHYSIQELDGLSALKKIFPEPVADEMNFVLFSTSGVHGSYGTIEEAEAEAGAEDGEEEVVGEPSPPTVTVLVVHPRLVCLVYGNVEVTPESAPYLKALRASSLEVVAEIGL